MRITIQGNFISIQIPENEGQPDVIQLPDGYLKPYIIDISKSSEIKFYIEKFGQIPDPHYFYKAFEPILVTGDDGNEYKVIPSDQFK